MLSAPQKRLRYVGGAFAAALVTVPVAFAAPALAAPTPAMPNTAVEDVVINEVIQDSDRIEDAVELMNIGSEPVDISGWIVADDKDRDPAFVLPEATIIEPGDYLAVTVDVDGDEGFGFGKEDIARLTLPDGTEVARFAWSGHQPTSYGRNPDGTGEFKVTKEATPGAPNVFAPAGLETVVINEVESSDGEPGDWVELFNTGDGAVDLTGWVFTDDDDEHTYELPAGSVIDAGAYLVLDAFDNAAAAGDAGSVGFDFGLGSGDSARIFMPDGVLVDETTWDGHAATTWGRCPTGVGIFEVTAASTKGADNECVEPEIADVRINEIETSGGTPDDWVEFVNTGDEVVDMSGWVFRDDSDADDHTYEFPAGTSITPGDFMIVESAELDYGLGAADMARLYLPGGFTVVDQHAWNEHASTTIGRCPDGTGDFRITTAPTKGAANDCSDAVRINEVESSGDAAGDWIELVNAGPEAADLSGLSLRDGGDNEAIAFDGGTELAAGAYLQVFTEPNSGLGSDDVVQLIGTDGETIVDETTWSGHAAVTWGRCPDATGAFGETREATPGAKNDCEGDLITEAWPGSQEVSVADAPGAFGGDMSGIVFDQASTVERGIAWAVNNGNGTLHRLVLDDGAVTEDAGWEGGATLRYPDATGTPDAEAVGVSGEAGVVYVGTERNNAVSGSRPSVLRYEVGAVGVEAGTEAGADAAGELTATHEWNLAQDYPGIGNNAGIEGVAWIPDAVLTGGGLVDANTDTAYDPAQYPGNAGGLFFVAVEATNLVAGYALQSDGTATRVTEFETVFPGVMELEYEPATGVLWAMCDDVCEGLSQTFAVADGAFAATGVVQPPAAMDRGLNNEGLAFAPQTTCVDHAKPVLWTDDAEADGHAIRLGSIDCENENVGGGAEGDSEGSSEGNADSGASGAGDSGAGDAGSAGSSSDSIGAAHGSGDLPVTGAGESSLPIALWAGGALAAAGIVMLLARRSRASR